MALNTWGTNKLGEVGNGTLEDQLSPALVDHFKGIRLKQTSLGEFHSMAVSVLGDVFVWGRGVEGQHGDGERKKTETLPQRVWALQHERICLSSCGNYHCLALSEDGHLYQWGRLHTYQKADDSASSSSSSSSSSQGPSSSYFNSAIQLPSRSEKSEWVSSMINSSMHNYYASGLDSEELKEKNEVTNFGTFKPFLCSKPQLVEQSHFGEKKVVHASAGYSFSLCVTEDGKVYGWGYNEKFQLGLGHRYNQDEPKQIIFPDDVFIVKVACGQQHAMALTNQGHVWSWGLSVLGQTGLGTTHDIRRPQRIETLVEAGVFISQIACGSHHSAALEDTGNLWTWGSSEYGQLGGTQNFADWGTGGRGKEKNKTNVASTPRLFNAFGNQPVMQIACGNLHNLVLLGNGDVYGWGWNSSGALGISNRRFQLIPVLLSALSGQTILSLACGGRHSSCIISGGTSVAFAYDFKQVLLKDTYHDWRVRVGDAHDTILRTTQIHKCIAFARCPRLRAIFAFHSRFVTPNTDQDQDQGGHNDEEDLLTLKGIRYGTWLGFLHYLYTDHVKVAPHLISELGSLGRKFNLNRLEELCERQQYRGKNPTPPPSSRLPEDLLSLVDNPFLSDIAFVLTNPFDEGDEIPSFVKWADAQHKKVIVHAHKVILYCRCDYFKAIFESKFSEANQEGDVFQLSLSDITHTAFITMLKFIYTGEEACVTHPDIVVEMLMAADRFLLLDLKQLCEAEIENSLDVSNVADILQISDRCTAPRLKKACLALIVASWSEFILTPGFVSLKWSPTSLLRELDHLACKKECTSSPGQVIKMINTQADPDHVKDSAA